MILETERLYLREMNHHDFKSLCRILQDEETMEKMTKEAKQWLFRKNFMIIFWKI